MTGFNKNARTRPMINGKNTENILSTILWILFGLYNAYIKRIEQTITINAVMLQKKYFLSHLNYNRILLR